MDFFIDIVRNIYLLPCLAAFIVIGFIYLFQRNKDKEKQINKTEYLKYFIIIYITTFIILYIFQNNNINSTINPTSITQSLSSSTNIQLQTLNDNLNTQTSKLSITNNDNNMIDIDDINLESFMIGNPNF